MTNNNNNSNNLPKKKKKKKKGFVLPKSVSATNSYIGHRFEIVDQEDENEVVAEFRVLQDKQMYVIPPENPDDDHYKRLIEQEQFLDAYLERTGKPWLSHYPRYPPVLHMWPARYIGEVHHITTDYNHWICADTPLPEKLTQCKQWTNVNPVISVNGKVQEQNNEDAERDGGEGEKEKKLRLQLEVISIHPKIFVIENMLSMHECDLIVDIARDRLHRSLGGQNGGFVSSSRTSQNTWVESNEHFVISHLYKRAADILNVSTALMTETKNAESLQVVNYKIGQECSL
ncbi:prolyl 4-hydroxylase, alpha subunit [Reticulomyxa filosa]|uniref:Prolyl 4-hydroxylase, alpha subunit n=1 Tax=Reticulomyxa filosa TaxID=46433 RepID=X6PB09_RETFI|nr:prolyl 4-hydroxylase, alpha subunit [Reticulomyxa filosa]|eukprot:ETO35336.1 prolyl 4-hydroxylase, alpha subunit [Reticulomyxa filosa]